MFPSHFHTYTFIHISGAGKGCHAQTSVVFVVVVVLFQKGVSRLLQADNQVLTAKIPKPQEDRFTKPILITF